VAMPMMRRPGPMTAMEAKMAAAAAASGEAVATIERRATNDMVIGGKGGGYNNIRRFIGKVKYIKKHTL